MNIPYFNLFNIFIIFPLFLFVGYHIFYQLKLNKISISLILLSMIYLLIIHSYRLFKGIETIKTHGDFKREAGLFIIIISFLILGFNLFYVYKTFTQSKDK